MPSDVRACLGTDWVIFSTNREVLGEMYFSSELCEIKEVFKLFNITDIKYEEYLPAADLYLKLIALYVVQKDWSPNFEKDNVWAFLPGQYQSPIVINSDWMLDADAHKNILHTLMDAYLTFLVPQLSN